MGNYNQNSGYGQALVNAVRAQIPFFGKIFVVFDSDDVGDENYNRLQNLYTPDPDGIVRFYTSLSDAYNATTSNNNDVIVIDGDGTHTLTTKITVSKNRVHFVSMEYLAGIRKWQGQSTKISIGGSTAGNDACIENTGVRNTFRGLRFWSSNSSTSALYAFKDGGEFTYMDCCHMVRSGVATTTTAADMLCNGDSSHYKRCTFGITSLAITANGNRPCVDFGRETITGKVARDTIFEDCVFMRRGNDSDNSFMYGDGATDIERMCLILNPIFWQDALASANMDECVSFTAQTNGSVLIMNPGATGTPASISTSTGVFVTTGSMDGTNPEAKIGIAIQCT